MHVTLQWKEQGLSLASKEEQSKVLDEEVEAYSQWLAALPDSRAAGAMNSAEKALIKTYLIQKLTGKLGEG